MPTRANAYKILIFIVFFILPLPVSADGHSSQAVVEAFQRDLLQVMKEAKTLGFTGRYKRLKPPIEKAFHLPLMVRVATKPFWEGASKEQRRHLITAFKRMNISTLATLFSGYSGQTFRTRAQKPGPQGTVIVGTELVDPDGSTVELDYVTKQNNGKWLIVDVIVDGGISELAVRKSEYSLTLRQKGIQGLIDTLNNKADELISRE